MLVHAHNLDGEYGTWQVDGKTPAVEYSLTVLEELRQAGEEGFQKIPHGGIEVGGLLLGRHEEGVVRIEEWRRIECRHARGPGFVLCSDDIEDLEQLLADCRESQVLAGLEPVGWYHTHTRSGLFLSGADIAIHKRLFPEPWQVALVLVYSKEHSVVGGFFVPEPDGSLQGEASPREFPIRPNVSLLLRPKRTTAEPPKEKEEAPAQPLRPVRGPVRGRGRRMGFSAGPREPVPVEKVPAQYPDELPAMAPSLPVSTGDPYAEAPRQGFRWRLLAVVFAMLALIVAVIMTRPQWALFTGSSQTPIALHAEEYGDQLVIRWNHNAPKVQTADRGVLLLVDGGKNRELPLTAEELRSGTVTAVRHADDVEVRLSLYSRGSLSTEEVTRFVGAQPRPTDSPVDGAAPAPASITDLDTLQRVVDAEKARSEQLRQSIQAMQERLAQKK